MSITSSININSALGTINQIVFLNGVYLDEITFINSTKELVFPKRDQATLNINDYLLKLNLFFVFNNAISAQFNPIQTTVPFSEINTTISNDGISELILILKPGNHILYQHTCTYPNGGIIFKKRNQVGTLSYAQWLYFIYVLSNYVKFVRNVYKI